ncbi:class I SAM-dependent methyltransferase [Colwellia sp. M166]|uniref:class I SAM-dependent methyltransferase n=1 Tax=Colwellia sp. M166 TaxID=2583805 RepID=UPI00211E4894|nr:methyltransferase [Colwellia sp. M166]UUO23315.1 class I SAM-dependent methyltransferase [Colwellia sp. M166]|tara:strand:- start:2447 stop:3274 length:828 start_codon:yes stop_codon:yes gene_type:complete
MHTTAQTIKKVFTASIISATLLCSGLVSAHQDVAHQSQLEQAIAGEHRSAKNKARDEFRHPKETLEFFGFKPSMTVVEITPGGGWYTEILAPAIKGKGKLYGAHYPDTGEDNYYSNSRKQLVAMLASNAVFSEVELTNFVPRQASELAPAGTADLVLTFRNLHNWRDDGVEQAFKDAYKALKKGGVLGVVEHRLPAGVDAEKAKGYVSQSKTIEQAKAAGFTLAASSEINANAKDSVIYPKGVWTLPPVLRLGEQDKAKYMAIGESDRMTLKFVK